MKTPSLIDRGLVAVATHSVIFISAYLELVNSVNPVSKSLDGFYGNQSCLGLAH
jgi:hypothetical protein